MRNLRNILGVLACGVLMTGCTDNFDATNTNPNKITVESGKLSASSMFEPLLYGGANFLSYYSYYWSNELSQFTALTGNTLGRVYKYDIGDANWTSVWNTYAKYASNAEEMHRLALKQDDKALQAIALTMKALYMSSLSDIFGDIPYAEAFKASEGVRTPKFDSQERVYQLIFADLENANIIYASNPMVSSASVGLDGMYSMNMAKWRKFNNSLYLRLLCRLSGRPATIAYGEQTIVEKINQLATDTQNYPIFASNEDNATVKFSGISPYYSQFDPKDYTKSNFEAYRITKNLINLMVVKQSGNNAVDIAVDPRLPIFATQNKIGYWNGCGTNVSNTDFGGGACINYSTFSRINADEWFMDFSEVQFILAEAAMKGYIAGGEATAKEYYETAVKASLKKWSDFGVAAGTAQAFTDMDIAEYMATRLASWDNAENKFELIGNQRYLASFFIGMESWTEYRRTGYPTLTVDESWLNDGVLPTRFAYPNTTIATNRVNAEEALNRMGGPNDMKTPLWWSKKAIEKGL